MTRTTPEEARERYQLAEDAKAEHAAFKRARAEGKPLPATPALDELRRRQADMTSTKPAASTRTGGGGTRTPKAMTIHFTHDGLLVSPTQNKLSSVAWFYTKGLGKGGGRMKVDELKTLLKIKGVADPYAAGWSVKLDNGITLGAVRKGEVPTPVAKPAKAAAAKKSSRGKHDPIARKAPAAKKSTAKKPAKSTAKKPTTKSVSALLPKATPKKQTAKARAASEAKTKGIVDAVVESSKSGPNAEATKAANKKARATASPTKLAPDNRARNATKAAPALAVVK